MADPLVIAGGPCAQNPEPLAPFIDVFVTGDGEPSLPRSATCGRRCRTSAAVGAATPRASRPPAAGRDAARSWPPRTALRLRAALLRAGVPRRPPGGPAPDAAATCRRRSSRAWSTTWTRMPAAHRGRSCPFVECVHDRIAIEIMRGCPWQCRFCQSTVIKRPLRFRSVQTIVDAALESYRNTGFNEISHPVAVDQRLPALRRAGPRTEAGLRAAGREHLACPACG